MVCYSRLGECQHVELIPSRHSNLCKIQMCQATENLQPATPSTKILSKIILLKIQRADIYVTQYLCMSAYFIELSKRLSIPPPPFAMKNGVSTIMINCVLLLHMCWGWKKVAHPAYNTLIFVINVWFVLRINKFQMKETMLKMNQQYTHFICNATFWWLKRM